MSRRQLFLKGNAAAAQCRDELDLDDSMPVSPYDIAGMLGVRVWVQDEDIEGIYVAGNRPRILISCQRPMVRRTFTVAHELGHHIFGHQMSVDAQYSAYAAGRPPEEDLADAFAGHLLMPAYGIRHAFHKRGVDRKAPTPVDVLAVSSDFGVGYGTLVSHLRWGTNDIDAACAKSLLKVQPKALRQNLIGDNDLSALVLLDELAETGAVELEAGAGIIVKGPHKLTGEALELDRIVGGGRLYRAVKRGKSRIARAGMSAEVRIWPKNYKGEARWRALEETGDD